MWADWLMGMSVRRPVKKPHLRRWKVISVFPSPQLQLRPIKAVAAPLVVSEKYCSISSLQQGECSISCPMERWGCAFRQAEGGVNFSSPVGIKREINPLVQDERSCSLLSQRHTAVCKPCKMTCLINIYIYYISHLSAGQLWGLTEGFFVCVGNEGNELWGGVSETTHTFCRLRHSGAPARHSCSTPTFRHAARNIKNSSSSQTLANFDEHLRLFHSFMSFEVRAAFRRKDGWSHTESEIFKPSPMGNALFMLHIHTCEAPICLLVPVGSIFKR